MSQAKVPADYGRWARLVLIAGLAGLGLGGALYAYLPLLDNYFVADDYNYLHVGFRVLHDPTILFYQERLYEIYAGAVLRPVGDLLWAGLVAVFGVEAAPYYRLMIAVHLVNGVLLALVLGRWFRRHAAEAGTGDAAAPAGPAARTTRPAGPDSEWLLDPVCGPRRDSPPPQPDGPDSEHLLDPVCDPAGTWQAWRVADWAAPTAVLAAAMWLTAYGVRNGVCWIANLNESLILTVELLLLGLLQVGRRAFGVRLVIGLALALGCLMKESLAPFVAVLLFDDWLARREAQVGVAWYVIRWAINLLPLALYLAVRLHPMWAGIYPGAGAGAHSLLSYPALVASAFGSNLLPVYFGRVWQAPELVPLLGWTVAIVLLWLVVRGRGPARVLALWVLVQPLPYSLVPATVPENLQSHYLYCATAPAMGLVALGLMNLFRLTRSRPALRLVPLLLSLLLLAWTHYGLDRNRQDEASHWQVASDTLRRDFALFDAAGYSPETIIYLIIPPDQTPGGGAWWGWWGYWVVSPEHVRVERVNNRSEITHPIAPYAIYTYDKASGPRLLKYQGDS